MNPATSFRFTHTLRAVSALLLLAILFNQSARAATIHQVPATAQTPPAPPPQQAPVPTQIAAAHTIFLVNNGVDANFPLSADVAYNQVYAALQTWGHFQLVSSPDQADLVFQLRGIAPVTGVYGDRAGTYSIDSPAFQLAIKNPKSNVTLWTINSPVQVAGRKSARAHWLNISVTNLVSRVKVLANQPLDQTETAELTTYPHYHGKGIAIAVIAITFGAAVATGFIMKHEFDNKVASQNAALCAQNTFFCNLPTP
ncbi:MAG TPA: hypothetical protein VK814_11590 [Acidobacteriaceae bacterium]|nr:hypothetical protein [Acidobacteriaceae bacterium]